jgi:hypothetical protein
METLKAEENTVKFRAALEHCTSFAQADRALAREGMESATGRRLFIIKNAPKLYNALMSKPYDGTPETT